MILLTAFKPFNNRKHNASLEVLNRLDTSSNVFKAYLEVDLKRTISDFNNALNDSKPDMIIMLGEAGHSEYIEIEKVAHNVLDFKIEDNMGYKPQGLKIALDMPDSLHTSLDIEKLLNHLKEQGFKVKESNDAGTFICNYLYYNALLINENSLFIHLPRLEDESNEENVKTMDINQMVDTIKEVIKYYDN